MSAAFPSDDLSPEPIAPIVQPPPAPAPVPAPLGVSPSVAAATLSRIVFGLLAVVAFVALVLCIVLWQKVSGMQEQLARQSADALMQAAEARTLARQAQETVRDTAARLALTETRVGEVALQRSQLEDLMQSLSRSRDENLVVDIESAVRLALQQAEVTGNTEPLLAALKAGDLRITRAAQPRLAPLQRGQCLQAGAQGKAGPVPAAAEGPAPAATASDPSVMTTVQDVPLRSASAATVARSFGEVS